jgi:hypothetical protein
MRLKVMPIDARSDATRKSQASASDAPGARRGAVDRGDHRLLHLGETAHHPHAGLHQALEGGRVAARQQVAHHLHVGAGAEAAAGAGEHQHPHLRRRRGADDGRVQVVAHGPGEGVQPLGAVEDDPGDAVLHPQQHRLAHGSTRATIIEIPWPTPMHMDASP